MGKTIQGALARSIAWKNQDNAPFYVKLGVEGLKIRAEQCGLLDCPDLESLSTFLNFHRAPVSTILEIGAGYGRVAAWLSEKYPAARLSLVELSGPSAEYLRKSFYGIERISVVEKDLLKAKFEPRHDLALWMWAGCLDFAADQKLAAITQIAAALVSQGILAIEIPQTTEGIVQRSPDGQIAAELLGHRYHGHLPSNHEIIHLARLGGMVHVSTLSYSTNTGLKRSIFVFQKPEIN